jgi:hypothetical protein
VGETIPADTPNIDKVADQSTHPLGTHCDKRPAVDHRAHDCDHRCGPHRCKGLSNSTIREIRTILDGAFGRAVAWDWLGVNPWLR